MAVTEGRSAANDVLVGFYSALNVAALKTGLGFAVGVYTEYVPQNSAMPYVRTHFVTEVPNSTYGINGKNVIVWVHIHDDMSVHRGPGRVLMILDKVIALLNPAGNYAALVVPGHRTIHVECETTEDGSEETVADKALAHKIARFRVTVEEV